MKLTHKEVSDLLKVDESKELIRKEFFNRINVSDEIINNGFNKTIETINTKWCNCENKCKGQKCLEHDS